jgi:hypothetical protein
MSYSTGLKNFLLPLLSLSFSVTLFLGEIIKNHVLNRIGCCTMKNCNATLMFPIYNKDKEGKIFKYKHE